MPILSLPIVRFFPFLLFAESGGALHAENSAIIFIAEIVLMLVVGRLLCELMLRIRQPEVLGLVKVYSSDTALSYCRKRPTVRC